jgi:hypothetical protein
MKRKKLKRIHVNRHHIAANRKAGNSELSVFTAKTYNENITGKQLALYHNGECVAEFVYRPDKPLSCGAVAWIETKEELRVLA